MSDGLTEILKILIPFLIAAGTGGAALWRQMTQEERARKQLEAQRSAERDKYRLEVENAVWKRTREQMQHQDTVIDELRVQVKELKERVNALEESGTVKDDRIDYLEAENLTLRNQLANG